MAGSQARPSCAKCGGEVVEARLYGAAFVRLPTRLMDRGSPGNALVCTHCGYAEMYVRSPEKLRR